MLARKHHLQRGHAEYSSHIVSISWFWAGGLKTGASQGLNVRCFRDSSSRVPEQKMKGLQFPRIHLVTDPVLPMPGSGGHSTQG